MLGKDCIDVPLKKIMYHDWSETPKDSLHGKGFSLYPYPVQSLTAEERELKDIDFILYGVANAYGEVEDEELNKLVGNDRRRIWHLDGHDLYGSAPKMIIHNGEVVIGNQFTPSFKRELVCQQEGIYPIGFGIPEECILPIDLNNKIQLFQSTAPDYAIFNKVRDLGGRNHYKFTHQEDYYADLARSYFGLTCKKGGWDCLRHYEIIAAGTALLFRDFKDKPFFCSPVDLPTLSYSTWDELYAITERLIVLNPITDKYLSLLSSQRQWLLNNGTTKARAKQVLNVLSKYKT